MTYTKSEAKKLQTQSWYDLPRFYEIGMEDETPAEVAFVAGAIAKYATIPVRSIVEPACGPGQLARTLARQGYHVAAFDLNPNMIEYARKRSDKTSSKSKTTKSIDWFVGDMTDFRLPNKADAAVCLLDSFRHLATEAAAVAHLKVVAANVNAGGLYLLGLHLVPPDADPECTERWSNARGATQVTTTLRVLSSSRKTRLERIRISLLVRENGKELRVRDEFDLRLYTAAQIKTLFAAVPEWELCDVFDFWYELDAPLKLTNELSDTVFVLRRR